MKKASIFSRIVQGNAVPALLGAKAGGKKGKELARSAREGNFALLAAPLRHFAAPLPGAGRGK